MEYSKETINPIRAVETFETNKDVEVSKKKSGKISFKTAHGLVLGLNQFFARQCKKNPLYTYTAQELNTIFYEKVQQLNVLAKQEEVKLEEWDNQLPILNKGELEARKVDRLDELKAGMRCPTCNQFVKRYKRKLNSGMARTLIYIYKYFKRDDKEEWLHVKDYLRQEKYANSHDWTLLKYWGLIEEMKSEREDGSKRVGFYNITETGIRFVELKSKVRKHIFIYNNEFLGFDDEEINIKEALGEKFSYEELMQS